MCVCPYYPVYFLILGHSFADQAIQKTGGTSAAGATATGAAAADDDGDEDAEQGAEKEDEEPAGLDSGEPAVEGEGTDWKTLNRQRKKKAGLFVCVADLTERFVTAAVGLGPSMALLFSAFKLASAEFDKEQDRLLHRGEPRTFRVLETARGTLIKECFEQVGVVMGQCPMALPRSTRTRCTKSILFRLLSSLLCSITSVLRRYHEGFPYQLFRILDGKEAAAEVFAIPACMRDELSTRFFELFPTLAAATSVNGLAILQSLAILVEVDTWRR